MGEIGTRETGTGLFGPSGIPDQPDAPGTPVREEDARVEGADAFETDEGGDEDVAPEVDGVPGGSFRWSEGSA